MKINILKKIIVLIFSICLITQIKADEKENFLERLNHTSLLSMLYAYEEQGKVHDLSNITSVQVTDPNNNNAVTKVFLNNETTKVIEANAGKAFVGLHPTMTDTAIVLFRGTIVNCNWKHNVMIKQVLMKFGGETNDCSACKVHEGFLTHYNGLRAGIKAALDNILTSNITNIVITGHSLGGANANLAVADLSQKFPTKKFDLMTFGAPRVGNLNFASLINNKASNHIRILAANNLRQFMSDLVTTIPWANIYVHAGTQITIAKIEDNIKFNQKGMLDDQSPRLELGTKVDSATDGQFTNDVIALGAELECTLEGGVDIRKELMSKGKKIIDHIFQANDQGQQDTALSNTLNWFNLGYQALGFGDASFGFGRLVATSGNQSDQTDLKTMIANHSWYQEFTQYPGLLKNFWASAIITGEIKAKLARLLLNSNNSKKLRKQKSKK
jgi:predicted lipase